MEWKREPSDSLGKTQALIVFLAGVAAALHIWKLPPALPVLQETLAITLTQAGWLVAVFQIAGMLLGVIFGLFVQQVGLKNSILAGSCTLAAASFVGAQTASFEGLLIFRVLEGFALLMVTMAAPGLMRLVAPPAQQNFFLALWSAYIPTATVITLFAGTLLLSYCSWSILWNIAGIISLLMAGLVWFYIRDTSQVVSSTHSQLRQAWPSIKGTLSLKGPWLVAIAFSMYTSQWVAIISFLPIIYQEAGVAGAQMATFTAIAAGVNILGNLMAGRLLQRQVLAGRLLNIAFITMIVTSFVAFGLDSSPWTQFIAITVFSAVGGLAPATLFNQAVKVSLSPQTLPLTIGWLQQWISAGQFAGPVIIVLVVEYTQGWGYIWVLTGCWGLLGIALSHMLCRTDKS